MLLNSIAAAIVALLPVICAPAAENPADTLRRTRAPRQRTAMDADTLDTGIPGVRAVLFKDGKFRFLRDPGRDNAPDVYSEHWDTWKVNPYPSTQVMPERVTLWVVDSLGGYSCPNATRPLSRFGYRHGIRHQGVDLPYPASTQVNAAFDGRVRISDFVEGYGNLVVVRHPSGLETFYGNLSRRYVQPGDQVNAGDAVGTCGETGETRPALHFETRYKGYAFNPEALIDFEAGVLRHRLLHLGRRDFTTSKMYVQDEGDEEAIHSSDEKDRLAADGKGKKKAEAKAAADAAAKKYYTVKAGDTLAKIARKNGMTVKTLCRLNNIKETTVLQPGRKLRVK